MSLNTEPVSMSWAALLDTVYNIFRACKKDDVWGDYYKEPEEQKEDVREDTEKAVQAESNQGTEPVATSQQNEEKGQDSGQNKISESRIGEQEFQNGQEAAGSENEESRAQTEACADDGQAGEPASGTEPADEEDGAGGGTGEDSAGGGAGGAEEPEKPGMTQTEAGPAEAAGVEDFGGKITNSDGMRRHIENQKQIISDAISLMSTYCDKGIWDGLIEEANAVITRAESVKNMEEMWNG